MVKGLMWKQTILVKTLLLFCLVVVLYSYNLLVSMVAMLWWKQSYIVILMSNILFNVFYFAF